MNVKHCSTDESCQSIVYSDASDIRFGGYIAGTPINIAHGMWFGVERGNSSALHKVLYVAKHVRI
jgi:hypothetical protein